MIRINFGSIEIHYPYFGKNHSRYLATRNHRHTREEQTSQATDTLLHHSTDCTMPRPRESGSTYTCAHVYINFPYHLLSLLPLSLYVSLFPSFVYDVILAHIRKPHAWIRILYMDTLLYIIFLSETFQKSKSNLVNGLEVNRKKYQ